MNRAFAYAAALISFAPFMPGRLHAAEQCGSTPFSCNFLYSSGTFTTIEVPGASQTYVTSINDSGSYAGGFSLASGIEEGFVYSSGTYSTISVPGASSTIVEGINNDGQLVGEYTDSLGEHGFIDTNGTFTTINGPDALATIAVGINDLGQVIGHYVVGSDNISFVYMNGIFSYPDLPAGAVVTGINDADEIIGGLGNHGFIYDGVSTSLVQVPGAVETGPSGINNLGDIVGLTADNGDKAFVLNAGYYSTFLVPGSYQTAANDINDAGQIVGSYTPLIPEPEGLSYLVLALGLLAAKDHLRRDARARAIR